MMRAARFSLVSLTAMLLVAVALTLGIRKYVLAASILGRQNQLPSIHLPVVPIVTKDRNQARVPINVNGQRRVVSVPLNNLPDGIHDVPLVLDGTLTNTTIPIQVETSSANWVWDGTFNDLTVLVASAGAGKGNYKILDNSVEGDQVFGKGLGYQVGVMDPASPKQRLYLKRASFGRSQGGKFRRGWFVTNKLVTLRADSRTVFAADVWFARFGLGTINFGIYDPLKKTHRRIVLQPNLDLQGEQLDPDTDITEAGQVIAVVEHTIDIFGMHRLLGPMQKMLQESGLTTVLVRGLPLRKWVRIELVKPAKGERIGGTNADGESLFVIWDGELLQVENPDGSKQPYSMPVQNGAAYQLATSVSGLPERVYISGMEIQHTAQESGVATTTAKRASATLSSKRTSDYDNIATGNWIPILNSPETVGAQNAVLTPDGLHVNEHEMPVKSIWARDMILRAKVKLSGNSAVKFRLRHRWNEDDTKHGTYTAFYNHRSIFGVGYWNPETSGPTGDIKTFRSQKQYTNEFFEFAFAVVGNQLRVFVDGDQIIEAEHDGLSDGMPSIGTNGEAWFRDVELQILKPANKLENSSGGETRILEGHSEPVYAGSFSPDGRFVVTGGRDFTLRLWNVDTRAEIRQIEGHSKGIIRARFSPDGARIASACQDGNIHVWNTMTGDEIIRWKAHASRVSDVRFTRDGMRILSCGSDQNIRLWNAETGSLIREYTGHFERVVNAVFTPDERHIVSASGDNTARVWNVETGQELRRFENHTFAEDDQGGVTDLAISPDGSKVVSSGRDALLRLWDFATCEEIQRFEGHQQEIWSCDYSADGRYVLSGSPDKTLRIWDVETGDEVERIETDSHVTNYAEFWPFDARLVMFSGGNHPAGQRFQLSQKDGDYAVRIWSFPDR